MKTRRRSIPSALASGAAVGLIGLACSSFGSESASTNDADAGQTSSSSGSTQGDATTPDGSLLGEAGLIDALIFEAGTKYVYPPTGHRYTVIVDPSPVSWSAAHERAASMGGYLATLTSEAENQFVFGLALNTPGAIKELSGAWYGPWFGATQDDKSSEPAGGWTWVDDTNWEFTAWFTGEPNNSGGVEHTAHFYSYPNKDARWADDVEDHDFVFSFVVEFDK